MKAEARSLYFLGECKKLQVPFFQRRYVWEEENWAELLASFKNCDVVPFLGSLILKEESGNRYDVIDGQQRLTTVTILAKAIYDCLPISCKQPSSGIQRSAESFLYYTQNAVEDFKDAHVKIEHSQNDRADYERIIKSQLQNDEIIDLDTINDNSSSILQCYKYYREALSAESEDSLKALFKCIFDQNRRVFVIIELEKGDVNEQTIFDTINRAGVRLSTADIIKNNLYRHLLNGCKDSPDGQKEVVDTYKSCWDEIFSKDQKISKVWDEERVFGNVKHNNLEFLLYCIACIKWGEDCDMFAKLASVYEREMSRMSFAQQVRLAHEIKEYALVFKKYVLDFKTEIEDEQKNVYIKYDDHVSRLLLILQKFKVQMFYPYVIKRLHEVNQDETDQAMIDDFKKLESFIVRRKISPRGTHDYTSKCYQIISNGINALVEQDLGNSEAKITDYEVKGYLANTNDDAAKMILFCIELYRRRSEAVDVRALEYGYTLEHIMPKKWEREWIDVPIVEDGNTLDPNTVEGKEFRNNAIQSLGNKTLLTHSLNSSIKNGSFAKKINGDGDNKPGYRKHTTLFVTQEIVRDAENDLNWDEAHIKERHGKLYAEFLEIWPSYIAEVPPSEESDEDPEISQYTDEQFADAAALLTAVPGIADAPKSSSTSANDIEQETLIPEGMLSLDEFISCVNVQSETIEQYIRNGDIVPDLVIQTSEYRGQKYFKKETLDMYVQKFGWIIIDDTNRKSIFMQMIQQMDMSYSYKPVFIKAVLRHADETGTLSLQCVINYFRNYYNQRKNASVCVEKANSIFTKDNYTDEDAKKVILTYPYDRFKTMQVVTLIDNYTIQVNEKLWKQLTAEEKHLIEDVCEQKLISYFARIS